MNRIILIGNGFDLAHNMQTRYSDFIYWYIRLAFGAAQKTGSYEDAVMTIRRASFGRNIEDVKDIKWFFEFITEKKVSIVGRNVSYQTGNRLREFEWTFKYEFIKSLFKNCYTCGWVDIENEYYQSLKEIILSKRAKESDDVDDLNDSFQFLTTKLEEYFKTLEIAKLIPQYERIFSAQISPSELAGIRHSVPRTPISKLILNFNYTSLLENYMAKQPLTTTLINIHGQLSNEQNPIIFGFGDEMDANYSLFEGETTNKFMRFFKTFSYLMTDNHRKLIQFIDRSIYQVYVLGHSCGLSDRTMLNMIFEHKNCKSIKIFYHNTGDTNNFKDLTMSIARHFRNKENVRKLLVNFLESHEMPQAPQ